MCYGIGQLARRARAIGAPDPEAADFAAAAMFTTLTNVNFNPTRFVTLLSEAGQARDRVRARYEQAAAAKGAAPEVLHGPAALELASGINALALQATLAGVDAGIDVLGADVVGLRNLNLYGLKGVCAYTHHANVLGYRSEEVDAGIEDALDFLADPPTEVAPLLEHALSLGRLNLKVMELLDEANTRSFGHPVPTSVRIAPVAGRRSSSAVTTSVTCARSSKRARAPASTFTRTVRCCRRTHTPSCTGIRISQVNTGAHGRISRRSSPRSRARS